MGPRIVMALVVVACIPAAIGLAYALARALAPVWTARLLARRSPVITTRVALPPAAMRARDATGYRAPAMECADLVLPALPDRLLIGRALVVREGRSSFVISAPTTYTVQAREERGRLVPRAAQRAPEVLALMHAVVVGEHAELRSRLVLHIETTVCACLATTLAALVAIVGRGAFVAIGAGMLAIAYPILWWSARGARPALERRVRELHQQLADDLRARADAGG